MSLAGPIRRGALRVLSQAGAFARHQGGGFAIIGAFGLPVLLVMGVGAIELQQVLTDKHRTQDVADASALEGAQQLAVTQNGAPDRAKAYAESQLTDLAARSDVTVTATMLSPGVMKVAIDTHRMSFFANLLPPGGFRTHAEATAKSEAMSPLCVLTFGASGKNDDLHLTGSAKLEAPACMSHANQNLTVDSKAVMLASVSEAAGNATGSITPAASVGAAPIPDPFSSLVLTVPTTCNVEVTDITSGIVPILPGVHCNDIKVEKTGSIQLVAGTHYFKGKFEAKDTSTVDGTSGVTLVFATGSVLNADAGASLNLKGAKSGPLAGFVVATARDYTADFHLPSDSITQITGTIYVPKAKLMIDGGKKSGQTSPWTVVAAQGLAVNQSADLVINANYATSDVPVPVGVGTKTGGTRLTH